MAHRRRPAQRLYRNRRPRLLGHSYKGPRTYYVTICAEGMACRFGDVVGGRVELNDVGRMVGSWLREVQRAFPHVALDEYVIMPNHMHVLLRLRRFRGPDGPIDVAPLSDVIQWFKTMTTNAYIRGVRAAGWPRFDRRLWQRGYYDRVVRDDEELAHFREYVRWNPHRWGLRERP